MSLTLPSIEQVPDFHGKRVLVRVDFNVPVAERRVVDDFRLRAVLPTVRFLSAAGAKVVLISHFASAEANDLAPVSAAFKELFPHEYLASTDPVVISEHIETMAPGEVVLLGNLRVWRGEEANDPHFAGDFCRMADAYVNEAFSVSHRAHASIVLFPKLLPSYAGLNLVAEIEQLSKAFNPPAPFLVIMGGAKFRTKQPLVEKFLLSATDVFIGGALANDFFKAKGYETGRSLLGDTAIPQEILNSSKLLLPRDVTVQAPDGSLAVKSPARIGVEEKIVDIGPESVEMLRAKAEAAKLIIWNGPTGIYEEGITKQTEELGIAVAESRGFSIVGGGDTLASLKRLYLQSAFGFASTGGGAMLEFLENETLPGIEALKEAAALRES